MAGIGARIKHAFNSFLADDYPTQVSYPIGTSYSSNPDRPRFRLNSERTIISSIYTRIAIDVAGVKMEHVKTDENGQYTDTIPSGLNNCLNVEANIDQSGRHFRMDMVLSLLTQGAIAIIPVDTTIDPRNSGSWDIKTMRVGEILQWWPDSVKVRAYNEKRGEREEIILPKSMVGIVENPFYSVMNEPNSTLQRLIHKLSLLDNVDEISSQGKLDIIIQLPYVVKSESRKNQAANRAKEIQDQLQGSTYGIAYTDGTEKITQLNRSVENNLLEQVKYLKAELYNELGITEDVMNGTADDVTMMNYFNRTVEPILDALVEGMARKFITKTARTQGQTIMYFQQPFKLMSIGQLGDIVDVFSRNQIASPNEFRPVVGLKPSKEPQANQLINSNMPIDKQVTSGGDPSADPNAAPADPAQPSPADVAEARLNKSMADLGLG